MAEWSTLYREYGSHSLVFGQDHREGGIPGQSNLFVNKSSEGAIIMDRASC